jgi:hypothetical protein
MKNLVELLDLDHQGNVEIVASSRNGQMNGALTIELRRFEYFTTTDRSLKFEFYFPFLDSCLR